MRRTHDRCMVGGCGRPHHAHGLCSAHGHRNQRHGDPEAGAAPRSRTWAARLELMVRRGDGLWDCWEWLGTKSPLGYGQCTTGESGRVTTAHRAIYEALVGPVPDGLELDHLCRNPSCVNPGHLEPVTHAENMRRMGLAHASPPCSEPSCETPAKGRGLCAHHYNRAYGAAHPRRVRAA